MYSIEIINEYMAGKEAVSESIASGQFLSIFDELCHYQKKIQENSRKLLTNTSGYGIIKCVG